jgi:parvulin-like peptidyl-prolyl isomerase
MKPVLEKATFDLPDGGVSEIVDTAQALIVVKVLAHQRPELNEVTAEIRNKVQQQKLDGEVDAMKKKAGVWMDQEYFKPLVTSSSASRPTSSPPHSEP